MKILSPKIAGLILGFLVLSGTVWLMGQHDYSTLAAGKPPVFAWGKVPFADGGAVEYRGFGYSVTRVHQLAGHSAAGEVETPGMTRFWVGQMLDYWIPFSGRASTNISLEFNR